MRRDDENVAVEVMTSSCYGCDATILHIGERAGEVAERVVGFLPWLECHRTGEAALIRQTSGGFWSPDLYRVKIALTGMRVGRCWLDENCANGSFCLRPLRVFFLINRTFSHLKVLLPARHSLVIWPLETKR